MRLAALGLLGLVAGCHARGSEDRADKDSSVHIAMDKGADGDQVSVNIPGFDAKVALPNIDLARHVDLDGIRLAPDTRVGGIDVTGDDARGDHGTEGGRGRVQLRFTSPQAPAALVDYYRRSASEAGYTAVTPAADALTAVKQDRQFALTVAPDGRGSRGTITMSGGE